jgi:hypothetical protein
MALLDEASAPRGGVHIETSALGLVDLGAAVRAPLDGRALLAAPALEVISGRKVIEERFRNFDIGHSLF